MPLQVVAVDYWAVIAAAVASIVLGSVWYGPLYGKTWMKLTGMKKPAKMTPEIKSAMMKSYLIAYLGSVVMAYVLAHFVSYFNIATYYDALVLSVWMWLGFLAVKGLGTVLWEGKSWNLYILNAGYDYLNLAVITTVLVSWA